MDANQSNGLGESGPYSRTDGPPQQAVKLGKKLDFCNVRKCANGYTVYTEFEGQESDTGQTYVFTSLEDMNAWMIRMFAPDRIYTLQDAVEKHVTMAMAAAGADNL